MVVSELNPKRLALAKEMGADVVIDGNEELDVIAAFERKTGRQPTVIFEAVGVPGMIQRCITLAEPARRLGVVGLCQETDKFEPMDCILKALQLIFTFGYSNDDYAYILELLSRGRLHASPLISQTIRLEELPAMFERMKKTTDQIKVVVEP